MDKRILLIATVLTVTSCGKKDKDNPAPAKDPTVASGIATGSGTAEPAKPPSPPVGPSDPELKKLTDAFAACKDKNTTCAAYAPLEAYMKSSGTDDKKKKANFDAMMACVDAGPVDRIHACAAAASWFSGYSYEAPKDAGYGRRLLAALRTMKTDEPSYAGSKVGEFLARWLDTEDAAFRGDLAAAMVDKKLEKRGRSELFRMCEAKCVGHKELFGSALATAQDATEAEEMRIGAMGSLTWVRDEANKKQVEQFFLAKLGDAATAPKIAMAAVSDLAQIESVDGYPKVIEVMAAHAKDQDWVPTTGLALNTYFRKPLAIDHKAGVDVALATIKDDKVTGWYKAYAIQPLGYANDKRVDAVLAKLATDKDGNVAKAAQEAAGIRKQAAELAKHPK